MVSPVEILERSAPRQGERTALTFGSREFSYSELDLAADRCGRDRLRDNKNVLRAAEATAA